MTARDASYDRVLADTGELLDRLVRRLRSASLARLDEWRRPVEGLIESLVRVSSGLEAADARPVPELPVHAYPDAVAVLGVDVLSTLAAIRDLRHLVAVQGVLRHALEATR